MRVFRLCGFRWRASAFTGEGAAKGPGRWNSAGTKLVYCAESVALAALEILANVEDTADLATKKYALFEVDLPDDLIWQPARLTPNWRRTPAAPASRRWGDRFVQQGPKPFVRVPSALVPGEFNFLLNPAHPEFPKLKIMGQRGFRFDSRFVR